MRYFGTEKGNGLPPISIEAVRLPLAKYGERRASVCACPCISIVANETLTFRLTIALQRFVLSIGIGFHRPESTGIVLQKSRWFFRVGFVTPRVQRGQAARQGSRAEGSEPPGRDAAEDEPGVGAELPGSAAAPHRRSAATPAGENRSPTGVQARSTCSQAASYVSIISNVIRLF